jgi:hypothetical protein
MSLKNGNVQCCFVATEAMAQAIRQHAEIQRRSLSNTIAFIISEYLAANPINVVGGSEPPAQN